MIVSINQPAYLPWLGYFDRIAQSDVHVVLDHVQFEKNSMVNRNKALANGKEVMLTIPLNTKGKFGNLAISEIEITKNSKWIKKHYSTIQQSYAKAPNKNLILPVLKDFYDSCSEDELLNEVLAKNLACFLNLLKIKKTKILYSSQLDVSGSKSDLVLNICEFLGATEYLSGPFGRDYLDEESFESHNIKIQYHDYQHPAYKQSNTQFQSHLSVIDLLFNDAENALDIIRGNKNVR